MSHRGRWGSLDYGSIAKGGFLVGAALFLVGVAGEVIGHALLRDLPAWSDQLLLAAMGVGILVAFLVPIVYGVVLPLTE